MKAYPLAVGGSQLVGTTMMVFPSLLLQRAPCQSISTNRSARKERLCYPHGLPSGPFINLFLVFASSGFRVYMHKSWLLTEYSFRIA